MADIEPDGAPAGVDLRVVFAVLLERALRETGAEGSIPRLSSDAWTIDLEEAHDGHPDTFVCRWSDGSTITRIDTREAEDVVALVVGLQDAE